MNDIEVFSKLCLKSLITNYIWWWNDCDLHCRPHYIQSSVVITRSNIVRWCMIITGTHAEYQSYAGSKKDTPYLALAGVLYGVSFVNIFRKINRVITAPYYTCNMDHGSQRWGWWWWWWWWSCHNAIITSTYNIWVWLIIHTQTSVTAWMSNWIPTLIFHLMTSS